MTNQQDKHRRQQRYSKIETMILVILAAALLATMIILAVRDASAAPSTPRPCPAGYIAKPCPANWGPACARCERIYVPGLPRR